MVEEFLASTQSYRCGDERAKPGRMGSCCRSPRATSSASRPRSEPETARLSELLSSACVRRGKRRRCRLYTSYSSRTRRNCNALDHNTTEITKLVRHLRDVQSDARIVISQGHCRDRQCAANDHRYLSRENTTFSGVRQSISHGFPDPLPRLRAKRAMKS